MKKTILLVSFALAVLTFPVIAQDDWNDNPTPATTTAAAADDWNDNATPAKAAPADDWNDNATPAKAAPADDWNDNAAVANPETTTPAPVTTGEAPAAEPKTKKSGGFGLWWLLIILVPVLYVVFRKKKKTNKPAEEPKPEEPAAEPEPEPMPADVDEYFVKVKGKEYGPYTLEQMNGFIAEGRMNKKTQVKVADEWVEAGTVEAFVWVAPKPKEDPKDAVPQLMTDDKLMVLVGGKEHGPYTPDQMAGFIEAGRMNKQTQVKIVGKTDWIPAGEIPPFAELLTKAGF